MSEMHFVPIPTSHEALGKTAHLWMPFIRKLAERNREPLGSLIGVIKNGQVQIGLGWDGEKAHALVGWLYRPVGDSLVAEIHWLPGRGVKEWRHLLPDLERYLKEHEGVAHCRPIARPGWEKFLKERGYRLTHYVMEKAL